MTMAKIKLAGKFPGEEQNGFTTLEQDWEGIAQPETVLVIARVKRANLDIPADGPRIAKAELLQVEIVSIEDEARVVDIMREACSVRGGFMAASADLELDGLDDDEDGEL
jgi:hypothetical protein